MPPSPLLSMPDPAEQMRRQLLVRVEALALLDEADAVQVQRGDAARLIRRDLPPDVRKLALLAEPLKQRLPLPARAVAVKASQSAATVAASSLDVRRHGENGIGVDAGGEHAAAAIDDVAALGRRRLRALLLALGARDEIGALEDLQLHEARLDADRPQAEQRRGDDRAPLQGHAPVERRFAHAARLCRWRVRRAPNPLDHRLRDHRLGRRIGRQRHVR